MKYVCLLNKDSKFVVEKGKDFNSHYGIVKSKYLKLNREVKTHLGKKFFVVKPNLNDLVEKVFERIPQTITFKDLSLLLFLTTPPKNSRIVDAGTGSGFASMFLAYFLNPCKIFTYEINEKYIEVAKKNFEISGLKNFIKVKKKDITKGIDEKNLDLVHLDMENSEKVIKHAYNSLKVGGYIAIFSPIIEQVLKVRKELKKYKFMDVTTVENLVRRWQFKKYLRPETTGILHTGFYTIARKYA